MLLKMKPSIIALVCSSVEAPACWPPPNKLPRRGRLERKLPPPLLFVVLLVEVELVVLDDGATFGADEVDVMHWHSASRTRRRSSLHSRNEGCL